MYSKCYRKFSFALRGHYRINRDTVFVKPVRANVNFSIIPDDRVKVDISAAKSLLILKRTKCRVI